MRGLGMLVLALAGCGFKPAEGVYELVRSDTESTGDYSVCGYWDGFIYDGLGELGVQLDPLAIVSEELGGFSACTMEDDASFSCLYTEDLDYTRTLDGAWGSASADYASTTAYPKAAYWAFQRLMALTQHARAIEVVVNEDGLVVLRLCAKTVGFPGATTGPLSRWSYAYVSWLDHTSPWTPRRCG